MQIPFGFWSSPLSAKDIAGGNKKFGDCVSYRDTIYWTESRPSETGRMTIMSWTQEKGSSEHISAPFSARSRVHEYGGGALLASEQYIFFVNDADQDIYRVDQSGHVLRLTDTPGWRYADLDYDKVRDRIIAVGEYHDADIPHPQNAIVSVLVNESEPETAPDLVVRGSDFFASPRISPNGRQLAFISWNLPDMPWDGGQLYIKVLSSADVPKPVSQADERAIAPGWLNDNWLACVIERAEIGRGELIMTDIDTGMRHLVSEGGADLPDLFLPHWQFGMRSVSFDKNGTAAITGFKDGESILHFTQGEEPQNVYLPGMIDRIIQVDGLPGGIVSFSDRPPAIARLKTEDGGLVRQIISSSGVSQLDKESVSRGEIIRFPAGKFEGFAIFYPPKLKGQAIAEDELPPMIVSAHGGPTGFAGRGYDPKIQFFTSRGFAYLDVDYRGSAGYGRAYREALDGQWGIYDVEDVISAANAMINEGRVNQNAIFISGGSAGGLTVLAALAASNMFKAGVSRYGVADLSLLEATTHKFEAGYLDRLIGLNAQMSDAERKDKFDARSPLYAADKISSPILFLQGLEDRVVPPSQAETMLEGLKKSGVKAAYHTFEGEGHGFRQPDNIKTALELELAFYQYFLRADASLPEIDLPSIPWVS